VSEPASSSIDKDARIAELEAALAARDTLIDTLRHQLAQLLLRDNQGENSATI
jgi:uncharacterized coiled-coil protein SlyX